MLVALIGAITTTDLVSAYADGAYQRGAVTWTYDATYGMRKWRYVMNAEAATAWAAGTVVMNSTASSDTAEGLVAATGVAAHRVIGVAQHAIPAVSWGWILCEGDGLVLADATGFTADTGLIPDASTAGCAQNVAAATGAIFALARATNAGSTTARAWHARVRGFPTWAAWASASCVSTPEALARPEPA
jgi:hypothetical protein